jgi:phenylpyruvate tautomerase PptA (4-oxalocrotonate tautomerase family)
MPLVRIDITTGHSPETRAALGDAVHRALVATFNVPEADRFQVISEHPPGHGLVITPSFLDVDHRPQAMFVQITAAAGRSNDTKRALYRAIADNVASTGAVRSEDVVINLTEVQRVDWSFGSGIAQYMPAG